MQDASRTIDRLLAEHHAAEGLQAAPRCDDATFLRRVTLDLAGRIPSLEEVEAFEQVPDRTSKIAHLLNSKAFPRHWSELWTAMLVGYSNAFGTNREALRLWLEEAFREGRPYDQIAGDLITATGPAATNGAVNFVARYPEDTSTRVARLFLGVRLDCARCHDHPSARWKKRDFRDMARFFDAVARDEAGEGNVILSNRLPDVDEPDHLPRFLTGARPRTSLWRNEFALFARHTQAFARNHANRMWYLLMGRGIVHAPDDFNDENPPAVPALLDALTEFAKRSSWDMRGMIAAICGSEAYQRSSQSRLAQEPAVAARRVFALRSVKPLTPEQYYDSLEVLYPKPLAFSRAEFLERTIGAQLDEDFSETWHYRESVQQMMQQLAFDLPAPSASLEENYRRVLGRNPRESDRLVCQDRSASEVSFALRNSSEFFFNH